MVSSAIPPTNIICIALTLWTWVFELLNVGAPLNVFPIGDLLEVISHAKEDDLRKQTPGVTQTAVVEGHIERVEHW
jgi:hypothetical protein